MLKDSFFESKSLVTVNEKVKLLVDALYGYKKTNDALKKSEKIWYKWKIKLNYRHLLF